MKNILIFASILLTFGCTNFSGTLTTERGENLCIVYFWNHGDDITQISETQEYTLPLNIINGIFLP